MIFASKHLASIHAIKEDKNCISAKFKSVDFHDIKISFCDNEIESFDYSCHKNKPCCHIATLLYYIENNHTLFKNASFYDEDIERLVRNIDEDSLRDLFIVNF